MNGPNEDDSKFKSRVILQADEFIPAASFFNERDGD